MRPPPLAVSNTQPRDDDEINASAARPKIHRRESRQVDAHVRGAGVTPQARRNNLNSAYEIPGVRVTTPAQQAFGMPDLRLGWPQGDSAQRVYKPAPRTSG